MIEDCKLLDLPCFSDERGSLTFLEGLRHVPFSIARVYYLHNLMDGAKRGAHAHKKLHQIVIAVSGTFSIRLDDGRHEKIFELSEPSKALYICPMIWRDIYNFSSDAVCLVLASLLYDEADYYRNYDDFLSAVTCKRE